MRMSSGVAGDLRVECVTLGFVRHPKGAIDPGHRRTPDVYPLNGRALADQESHCSGACATSPRRRCGASRAYFPQSAAGLRLHLPSVSLADAVTLDRLIASDETLVHELIHAIQYRAFGIDAFATGTSQSTCPLAMSRCP
jgi:hypothetical protein